MPTRDPIPTRAQRRALADALVARSTTPELDPAWSAVVRDACPYDVAPGRAWSPTARRTAAGDR